MKRQFVLSESGALQAESFSVPDEERVKKLFRKKKMLRFFFIEPIETVTGLCGMKIMLQSPAECGIIKARSKVRFFVHCDQKEMRNAQTSQSEN